MRNLGWKSLTVGLCLSLGAAACEKSEKAPDKPPSRVEAEPSAAVQPSAPVSAPASAPVRLPKSLAAAPVASAEQGTTTVRVFFTKDENPLPVTRQVPKTQAVLQAALQELLKGPTEQERKQHNVTSWFSSQTQGMLESVRLGDKGHAVINFKDFSKTIPNASTSAGSAMLLHELNNTVFQFPTVQSVEYQFQGSCQRFWLWLQSDCHTVKR